MVFDMNLNWDDFSKYIDIKNNNFDNLVYFHAFTGSYKNKTKFFNSIQNLNIYAFDMPGHGDTKFIDENLIDVDVYAELAIKFIVDNDIKNIILMGHSMGGGIILMIVNDPRIKHRVKKIILECPANPAAVANYSIIRKLIPNSYMEMEFIAKELFYNPEKFFINEKNFNNFLNAEFNSLSKRSYLKKIITLEMQLKFAWKTLVGINENNIDTLLILGSDDNIISYDYSYEIFSKKSNYKIIKILNSKHVPIAEKFDECFTYIKEFISR